jgi:F420-0:gamma-glutamyl ligase-like protein
MNELKQNLKPNQGKTIEKKVNDQVFDRFPLWTKIVKPEDDLKEVIREFAEKYFDRDDILVISERMVAITQGRLIHESKIKAGFFAKILIKFVKKWPNDPGFRNAKKMQIVINEAGLCRVLLAAFVSALTKPFGIRGLFYIICGNQVSEIDGFAPGTIPPYDEYAVLGPKNPSKVCDELAVEFAEKNISFAIVDANNIDTAILGISQNLPISKDILKEAFLDNPIGQGLEQTPICLVGEKG